MKKQPFIVYISPWGTSGELYWGLFYVLMNLARFLLFSIIEGILERGGADLLWFLLNI